MHSWPSMAQQCRGVWPVLCRPFTFAPALIKTLTIRPYKQKHGRGGREGGI